MSQTIFEKPGQGDAPVSTSNAPYTKFFNYKSGKTPEAFAANASPEQVKAGFSYYDKEAKQVVQLSEFTGCVVAVLSGVTGTVKEGDYYQNYYSNLIFDTRSEFLSVRCFGVDRPLFSGLYKDIKPNLPQGVGYAQFLICYIPQTQETVALELTTGLQMAIVRAISEATQTPAKKINLFNLCELTTKFWCFQFTREFEKRTKDGEPYAGKGEMYFIPKINVFVVKSDKHPDLVGMLNTIAGEVRDFVSNSQERFWKPERTPQPANTGDEHFPTTPPPVNTEDATPDEDGLPF